MVALIAGHSRHPQLAVMTATATDGGNINGRVEENKDNVKNKILLINEV